MLAYVLVLVGAAVVSSHDYYRDRIPNGHSVPDPCSGGIWQAVGHYDPHHHTHDKNPFAKIFASQGHAWTTVVCQADSDNDGKTNGEELGDPTCTWTMGAAPSQAAVGHPGICDQPLGSCPSEVYTCGCHGHNCVGK